MKNYDVYCMDGESWEDIPGYEGIYQASDYGRIRSVDGKQTMTSFHGVRTWKGRIIKYKSDNPKTGWRVSLYKGGKPKDYLVARLVAMTFLGKPDDFGNNINTADRITVNHIDGNRFNNRLDNLEWLTLADNIRHAFDNDLMPTQKAVILDLGNGFCRRFKSMAECSRYLGLNNSSISNAYKRGRNYITGKDGCKYNFILVEEVLNHF